MTGRHSLSTFCSHTAQFSSVAMVGLLCCSCGCAYTIFRFSKSGWGRRWRTDSTEVCILALGSYIGQGMEREAHLSSKSQKVLFYSQFLCGITLVAIFSARLAANLALEHHVKVVESLEDVDEKELNLYINCEMVSS